MNNLNYRVFYKAKFMLSCGDENIDMLWEFVNSIRRWQTWKWNRENKVLDDSAAAWSRLKNGNRMFSIGGSERPVYIESELFFPADKPEQLFWACTISEKKTKGPGYCERDWVTEIGFHQVSPGEAEFNCTISYGDTPEFIGRYEEEPEPTLPGLIGILIKSRALRCYSGTDEIKNSATQLQVGDFPKFRKALLDKNRVMPYIYISPRRKNAETEETEILINPSKLAKIVCGNARVFYSYDFAFTQEMSYLFDCKEYSCYGGSVRVYRPNLDDSDPSDAYRHRSLHPSFFDEVGEEEVLKIYRRALAQNVSYYEKFLDVDQCRKMKREEMRKRRIDELRAKHKKEIGDLQDNKLDEAIEEEIKRQEAEQRVKELENQLQKVTSKEDSLKMQIQRLKYSASHAEELEKALSARLENGKYPQTPEEIVQYFTTTFPDRIVFTESGMKSLKTCEFSQRDLWEILFDLSTVMWELMKSDNVPDPYKEFYRQTGIEVARGEGPATRKDSRKMRQFETTYQGRIIDIEPHITYNYGRKGQSLHFAFDAEIGKIIVGHCGEHLEIYSTRKRK